jgi:hypothetical protein
VRALPAVNVLLDCMPGQHRCGFPGSASTAFRWLLGGAALPDDACSPANASLGGNAQHCAGGTPCAGVCTPAHMCRNRTDGHPRSDAAWTGDLYSVAAFRELDSAHVDVIRAEIMAHGPVATGMCVAKAALNYTGGVLPASACAGCDKIDHDVNLVGWGSGATASGAEVPYWLVRNNWGSAWGEGGFFRIERGKNACALELAVRAPTPKVVKQSSNS